MSGEREFHLRLVIFDMDGTLTVPYLDFEEIRARIGAGGTTILEFIASIVDERERRRVRAIVDEYERDAAENSTLNAGAREALQLLRAHGIPVAILTRNNREALTIVTCKHDLHVDFAVCAEDGLAPKPSGEPVRHIAEHFGVAPRDTLMVGDFRFDVMSGKAAGAKTVFVTNRKPVDDAGDPDYMVHDLRELVEILRRML